MKAVRSILLVLAASTVQLAAAQVLDKLDVQVHGYATQALLYTTRNNIYTTRSSDLSPAWTEAVISLGASPVPQLRVGIQARYFLLGREDNAVSIDWAAADYKIDDHFGVRAGIVKTPVGLFNEVQDIDPAYVWSLLPQSIYPIASRDSLLSHNGGVVYGTLKSTAHLGKLEYRGWGGQQIIGPDDGYVLPFKEGGLDLPNGLSGSMYGAALRWSTPIAGLILGVSDVQKNEWISKLTAGHEAVVGTIKVSAFNQPNFFGSYEHNKVFAAAEYSRYPPKLWLTLPQVSTLYIPVDRRNWYAMATYKVATKLVAGLYYSQAVEHTLSPGAARFSRDWALSARYDFNQYVYAKVEQHFIDGTLNGYDVDLNPNGLKPDTRLTIFKTGVCF